MTPERKEQILRGWLDDLGNLAFGRSENSVTGEVEYYPEAIQDMEATIRINGEFDREDLINFIIGRMGYSPLSRMKKETKES